LSILDFRIFNANFTKLTTAISAIYCTYGVTSNCISFNFFPSFIASLGSYHTIKNPFPRFLLTHPSKYSTVL
jgi:hypothetical protein